MCTFNLTTINILSYSVFECVCEACKPECNWWVKIKHNITIVKSVCVRGGEGEAAV